MVPAPRGRGVSIALEPGRPRPVSGNRLQLHFELHPFGNMMLVFPAKLIGVEDRLVSTAPQLYFELHLGVLSGQELPLKVI